MNGDWVLPHLFWAWQVATSHAWKIAGDDAAAAELISFLNRPLRQCGAPARKSASTP
jgi:hypothetical protein